MSGDCIEAFARQKVEQFERGAAGVLGACFPLTHGRRARVQYSRQQSLDYSLRAPQLFDLLGIERLDWSQTQNIVLAHIALFDEAEPREIAGCLMDYPQKRAFCLRACHGQSPEECPILADDFSTGQFTLPPTHAQP